MMWKSLFLSFLLATFFYSTYAEPISYGIIERHGDTIPSISLLNEDSVSVELKDLVDKPTYISFVYYSCPGLCSPLLEGITEVIDASDAKIGVDYQVITISIDPNETPSQAKAKKYALIKNMNAHGVASHWRFYTVPDLASINKLTEAAGYYIQRNNKDIVHVAALLLLSPDRSISQYLYGTFFMPMHWSMAINSAAEGKQVPSRIKNLKYCYNFEKKENKNVTTLARFYGGITILFALGLYLFLVFSKSESKKTKNV